MKPWKYQVDVSDIIHADMEVSEIAKGIALRLKNSDWAKSDDMVGQLADDLAETDTKADFNYVWNQIYNLADDDKTCWINTWERVR